MTRWPLVGALLMGGCAPAELGVGDTSERTLPREDSAADTGDTGGNDPDLEARCAEIADIPVEADYLEGFTGAEDFAFDAEGNLVSIDAHGNLVAISQDGKRQVVLPRATNYGAGTRFLPDGDIVFCDVEAGSLVRVDPETGGSSVVLGGLAYPNGLDVGLDGFVYVSEQTTGQVRRVNPDSGAYTVILTDLYQPNGVTFAPGYERIFVGSFGAGVVWAADRVDDATWTTPRIYASAPEAPGVPPDWCDSHDAGESCPLEGGYSVGVCADDGTGDLDCAESFDFSACAAKAEGDACTSELFGAPVEQVCHAGKAELWCPRSPATAEAACTDKIEGDYCSLDGSRGQCARTFEGLVACWNYNDYNDAYLTACEGLELGADCAIADVAYPTMGQCADGTSYGYDGAICLPPGAASTHGGLDGINTDECGNLYVSEYILGAIWRFSEEGAPAEAAATLNSQWIPNMHWGNGRGGWDPTTLYVMDRVGAGVFALPLNVAGHGDAYVPPAI